MSPAGTAESGRGVLKSRRNVQSQRQLHAEQPAHHDRAEKTAEFISHLYGLVLDHDGNPGEVLDGIGERLGICFQLYDGLPAWTPRSFTKGWNRFDYTFVDVRRLGSGTEQSHGLITALASPETARRVTDLEALLQTAR
jgi:geranylgeranyl pyrophosphate synthase